MREKLNENPMVQMAVVGVLIVVVGVIFMLQMKSGSEPEAPPATSTPAATDPVTGQPATTDPAAAAGTDPAAAADPAAADATGAVPADGSVPAAAPPVGATTPSTFKAGPGLPKPVVDAYNKGGAVVLLVTKQRGADDKRMRKSVSSIRGKKDVDLFNIRVHNIAKYSRIAQGVDLDRVPALVVIQPKKFAGKGEAPTATVSYGYRPPASVNQAVEDQLYHGKVLSYSPK